MKAALIVKLEIEDPTALPSLALEVQDALEADGFDITSVEPWSRPSMGIDTSSLQGLMQGLPEQIQQRVKKK